MSSETFPDPRTYEFPKWVLIGEYFYSASDIISFGDALTTDNLREAYGKGIFPWHIGGLPLPWFCPERRAILEFDNLKISKSLAKAYRSTKFNLTIDRDFTAVVEACAETKRSHESGTWITDEFIACYSDFHKMGNAHSVEVWDGAELAGGLYGVDADGVFSGESMFFRRSNASKIALLYVIDHLKKGGATWIDIQVMTPHFKSLGAIEIPRAKFLKRLAKGRKNGAMLFE